MVTQEQKPEEKESATQEQKYKGVFYFDANGNKVDPSGKIIEVKK